MNNGHKISYERFSAKVLPNNNNFKPPPNKAMYRPKGPNYSEQQQLLIKVDLREIRFYPSEDIIRKNQCKQIELLLKYTSRDLGMNFVEGQKIYEIRIPLDQVVGFKVIQNKHIEIEFRKNFFRSYYVHTKSPKHTVNMAHKDPTNGCMKNSTSIKFTPCEKVHPMTIFMFEIGVKKWAPALTVDANNEEDDIYEAQAIEDLIIEDSPPSNNIFEYYVTCKFLTFTRAIRLSAKDTFADLLKEINKKLDCEINSFKYINDGDKITVENEEDWKFAKFSFKKQKISSFDIYIE